MPRVVGRKMSPLSRFALAQPARHNSPPSVENSSTANGVILSAAKYLKYSTAVLNLKQLFYIPTIVVLLCSFGGQKNQKPRHAERAVCLFFVQELQAISLSQKGIATNNLSFKHRGEGNSLFTQKQHREKHRSNNPSPFPVFERLFAVLFNGAGFSWELLLL